MLAVSSSNHRQRSGGNLADGHAIPGSGLLLTTWQTPILGFRKQERQLKTGSTGGCLRSIAQRTRSGACSYWIGCQAAICVIILMLITVDCRDGLTSAVQLIPKLWPFLNHSIRSVRRATLRTVSMLLATGRLKVCELFDVNVFEICGTMQ